MNMNGYDIHANEKFEYFVKNMMYFSGVFNDFLQLEINEQLLHERGNIMSISKSNNIKGTINKSMVAVLLAVTIACTFTSTTAMAAGSQVPYTILRRVLGDGVRLRSAPETGTVLELMYKNDLFWVDNRNLNDQIARGWMHGMRDSSSRVGYVDAHFVGY